VVLCRCRSGKREGNGPCAAVPDPQGRCVVRSAGHGPRSGWPKCRAYGRGRRTLCIRQCHPQLTAALQSRVRKEGDREAGDRPVVRVFGNGPGPDVPVLAVVRADARAQDERAAGLACGLQCVEDAWSIFGMKCAEPIGIRGILIGQVGRKTTLCRRPYADSFFSRDPRASLTTDGSPLT
jgi:hypothetical protein